MNARIPAGSSGNHGPSTPRRPRTRRRPAPPRFAGALVAPGQDPGLQPDLAVPLCGRGAARACRCGRTAPSAGPAARDRAAESGCLSSGSQLRPAATTGRCRRRCGRRIIRVSTAGWWWSSWSRQRRPLRRCAQAGSGEHPLPARAVRAGRRRAPGTIGHHLAEPADQRAEARCGNARRTRRCATHTRPPPGAIGSGNGHRSTPARRVRSRQNAPAVSSGTLDSAKRESRIGSGTPAHRASRAPGSKPPGAAVHPVVQAVWRPPVTSRPDPLVIAVRADTPAGGDAWPVGDGPQLGIVGDMRIRIQRGLHVDVPDPSTDHMHGNPRQQQRRRRACRNQCGVQPVGHLPDRSRRSRSTRS